jgi:Na+-driven multidrug efflux pump
MWFVRVLGAWRTVGYTGWGLDGIWVFWRMDRLVRRIAFI